MIGQTISHYKITEKLGEGGMGVVYKADDTKLKRAVALKFLAPHLLQDEEARKRFEREAQAAAALHHPNICPVYEIGEKKGQTFLAMAFIEGESLDKKIEQGPLKIPEALDIAQQIAKGLEAAHEKKIVHRDIKPGNVIVDEKGHVTVMDFGLALLTEGSKLTQLETTVGTAAYMSPEQIQGMDVDHRTDIWALGCVLYEMVCGQRPFKGVYDKALLYEIVQEEYEPITGVRAGVPMELEFIVAKCLAKKAEERYDNAGEVAEDLGVLSKRLESGKSRIARLSQESAAAVQPQSGSITYRRSWVPWLIAAAATAGMIVFAGLHLTEPVAQSPLRKFAFTAEGFYSNEARAAISPDGKYIAYTARTPGTSLWVQALDQENPRRLEETEGAVRPFWSPDSEYIGFFASGRLRRVPVSGGPVLDICRPPGIGRTFYGAWHPEGHSIVFASGVPARLFEVPAHGGEPRLLVDRVESGRNRQASSPQFLSDRILLYRMGAPTTGETLVARDLGSGEEEEWPMPAGILVYSNTGHIIYQARSDRPGELWALPFALEPLGPSGDPFPIAQAAGWASVALDGTLVYREEGASQSVRVRFVNRDGSGIAETNRRWRLAHSPQFSPDARRLILAAGDGDAPEIWLYSLSSRNWTRLTSRSDVAFSPVWAPDGKSIAFSSNRAGLTRGIYTQAAEPGEARTLIDTEVAGLPNDWCTVSGRILYYRIERDDRARDLWFLEPGERGNYEAKLFLSEPFNQRSGVFSPDGDWVAYVSDQDGANEVFIRKFPEGSPVRKLSRRGGDAPRWRADGRELFYLEGHQLMAVDVRLDDLSFGEPHSLFSDPSFLDDPLFRRYDVAPDGRSFAVVSYSPEALASPPVIRVIQNWYEEFRTRE